MEAFAKTGLLSYENVARELDTDGDLTEFKLKLEAIKKVMAVAKFLNKGWKPDWRRTLDNFYTLGIDGANGMVVILPVSIAKFSVGVVHFRTEELAKQAVQILGEDTVRLALSNDF